MRRWRIVTQYFAMSSAYVMKNDFLWLDTIYQMCYDACEMKITPVLQKKTLLFPLASAVVGSVVLASCEQQQQQQQLKGAPMMLGGVVPPPVAPTKGAPQVNQEK